MTFCSSDLFYYMKGLKNKKGGGGEGDGEMKIDWQQFPC